uniref:Zinc knuckle domain-containing protein n=1 Tax=Globisporangium ultimum (strain ATCC 200006 / CBS 805.95 / DAOM BR144) TaxID=431595 RepID=K3W7X4_GLOUD
MVSPERAAKRTRHEVRARAYTRSRHGVQAKSRAPEDAIPDKPENRNAREFLKSAPSQGLWLPMGVAVKVMQCWRCKAYGHRTGDRECPMASAGNLVLDAERQAREDPMAKYVALPEQQREMTRAEKKQAKREQLAVLLAEVRREAAEKKERKKHKRKEKSSKREKKKKTRRRKSSSSSSSSPSSSGSESSSSTDSSSSSEDDSNGAAKSKRRGSRRERDRTSSAHSRRSRSPARKRGRSRE